MSQKERRSNNRSDTRITASFFDKLSKDYVEAANRDYTHVYDRTMAFLQPYLAGKVLNLGSGGVDLSLNANIDMIVSLDISEKLLKNQKVGDRNYVVCGESGQVPFKVRSFDTVVAHFCLHHFAQESVKRTLEYILDSFNDINKVIKAGSTLIIAEITISRATELLEKMAYPFERKLLRIFNRPPVYLFSVKTLKQILTKTGFNLTYFTIFKVTTKPLILPFSIPKYINPISVSLFVSEKK